MNEWMYVFKQAIEHATTFGDKDKLVETLRTYEFKLPSLPYRIRIDPSNGTANVQSTITQYQNHERRTIAPREYAITKAWYLMPMWEEKFSTVGEYKPPPVVPL